MNLIRFFILVNIPITCISYLRLFDTPATPKTILQKSAFLSSTNVANSKYMKPLNGHTDSMTFLGIGGRKPIDMPSTPSILDRPKAFPLHNKVLDSITANINPFSPSSSKCSYYYYFYYYYFVCNLQIVSILAQTDIIGFFIAGSLTNQNICTII